MLQNGAECITRILMYVDQVLCPECQNFKDFYDEDNVGPRVQGSSVPESVSARCLKLDVFATTHP
jgi:hypothetical protein